MQLTAALVTAALRRRRAAVGVPAPHRHRGPGGSVRPAPPGLRPHPAVERLLARAVHVGPGDQPADLRHRHLARTAGLQPGRPAALGAQHRGDLDRDAGARPVARPDRPDRSDPAVPAVPLVLGTLHGGLPPHPRERGTADRAVRRNVERHPGGAGIPARAAQRRDLRGPERRLPRRQPQGVQPARDLHSRRHPDRQHRDRDGALRRRLPGGPGRPGARRADRVPAVPAGVLRSDGGRRDLLQLPAVGDRRDGEAGAGAGRGAGGARARESGAVAASDRR